METYVLLSIAILLPVLCAILCSVVKGKTGRSIIIVPASIIIAATAISLVNNLMTSGGKIELAFDTLFLDINWVVELCNIALLVYIIYIGFSQKKILVSVLAILQLIPMIVFEIFGSVKEPVNTFVIDYLSLVMILLISIIGPVIMVFAIGYMQGHEEQQQPKKSIQPRFFIVMFLLLGALNGLIITNNLLWMYFFWGITTLCSYLLISHDKTEAAIKSALGALWVNMLGGVAFALGIIFIYKAVGTAAIDEIVGMKPGAAFTGMLPIGLGFLCLAGFAKSAQLPFQSWLLGAMVAPAPASGLLHSSIMIKAGVYLIVRFAPVFSSTITGTIIAVAGSFTFLAGSVLAVSNRNAKRVLAYSTIANLGLIICCAGIGTNIALGAAILLIIFHALSKSLLFLCIGTIEQKIGSSDIEDMGGLMKKMPFTAVITVFGMVSMLLPPFGVMMTKWLAMEAAVQLPLVLGFILLGSAFTVFFWVKWIRIILIMSFKVKYVMEKLRLTVKASIAILAALVLTAGILIEPLFNTFVSPQLSSGAAGDVTTLTGGNGGLWLGNGNSISMGGFTSIGFFIIIFGLALTLPYINHKTKAGRSVPPYMGGGNIIDDHEGIEFMGPGDKREKVIVRDYDLTKFFNEDKLTLYVNLLAVAMILIMFGVVV